MFQKAENSVRRFSSLHYTFSLSGFHGDQPDLLRLVRDGVQVIENRPTCQEVFSSHHRRTHSSRGLLHIGTNSQRQRL